MKKVVYSLIALSVFYFFLHISDRDDFIYNKVHSFLCRNDDSAIQLDDYILESIREVACLNRNLSGITYSNTTQTLFAVSNSPAALYEIDKNGKCLRTIKLQQFNDPEGVVFIKENEFAVIEERRHKLSVINIEKNTTIINQSNIVKSITINMKDEDNKGFEGISYDPRNQSFYLVNEKRPMQLIRIEGIYSDTQGIKVDIMPNLIPKKLYMDDFSGLHFDFKTRQMLFISDESKLVSEVNLQGKMISFMELEKGFANLPDDIPQSEGITMDDKGNIYIVSEPNLFYKFVKTLN